MHAILPPQEYRFQFLIYELISPLCLDLFLVYLYYELKDFRGLLQIVRLLPRREIRRQQCSIQLAHVLVVLNRKLGLLKFEVGALAELEEGVEQPQVVELAEFQLRLDLANRIRVLRGGKQVNVLL